MYDIKMKYKLSYNENSFYPLCKLYACICLNVFVFNYLVMWMTSSFILFLFVRLNMVDIYTLCNRTHYRGYCYFFHVWTVFYKPIHGVSYLYAVLFLLNTWSPNLWFYSIQVEFLHMMYFSICAWLYWHIYLLSVMCLIGKTISRPNNSCPGLL